MTLAALDLATRTGYASYASGVVTSGTFCCYERPKDDWGKRFFRFRNWLRDWLEQEKPERLAYEDVRRWSSGDAAKAYCGLRAIMLLECHIRSIPVDGLAVGSIKKHATGSGRAGKQQMIEAARKRWGVEPEDDNEADALCILGLYLDTHTCKLTKPQTHNSKKSSFHTASRSKRSLSTSS